MEEYRDGTLGSILPIRDKLTELIGMPDEKLEQVKNVHVGTQEELSACTRASLEQRVARLELNLDSMMVKLDGLLFELGKGDTRELLVVKTLPKAQR